MGSRHIALGRCLLLGALLLAGVGAFPAAAAELKPEAVRAFDHYIELLEMRMDGDQARGNFLYIDRLTEDSRREVYAQIRRGDPYIEQISIEENGAPVPVPSGLIHHWMGVVFIPGATYSQALAVLLDFNKQAEIYKPDVQKSKLLSADGNRSKVFLQYLKRSLVTVVINANFDSVYLPVSPTQGRIESYSTRIAELENPGEAEEMELPVGKDHGYLWRLNSYWRVEEKDGGVYVQTESVALSRRIPGPIAWMIGPVVRKLSKTVIHNLLAETCGAVSISISSGENPHGSGAQGCAPPVESHDSAAPK